NQGVGLEHRLLPVPTPSRDRPPASALSPSQADALPAEADVGAARLHRLEQCSGEADSGAADLNEASVPAGAAVTRAAVLVDDNRGNERHTAAFAQPL